MTTPQLRLSEYEKIIKDGKTSFLSVGLALVAIQEEKLYKLKFKTFEKYCEEVHQIGRSYGYRLMRAAKKIKNKSVNPGFTLPPSARAALTDAKEEERGPVIELDRTGYPVPERAMKYWMMADEMQDLLGLISAARSAIRKQNQANRIFVELRLQEVVAILNDAYSQFALSVPYAVCCTCQGQAPDTCRLCQGRGVISKFRYDTCVPSDLKEVRNKIIEKGK